MTAMYSIRVHRSELCRIIYIWKEKRHGPQMCTMPRLTLECT